MMWRIGPVEVSGSIATKEAAQRASDVSVGPEGPRVPRAYHATNASPDRRRLVISEMTQDAF
jgi:hypothetical protein